MDPVTGCGQLWLENQRLLAEYGRLLDLFQRVLDGDQPAETIKLDHEKKSWAIVLGCSPKPPEATGG
jgi:hypothetical protein